MTTPNLKPIELKKHTCKQGRYGDIVPKLRTYEKHVSWAQRIRQNRVFFFKLI